MSFYDAPSKFLTRDDAQGSPQFPKSESSDDEDKRLKKREKNRVAAQKSRKRQTHRADELHKAYESLEQENSLLRKEVQLLVEEQQCLTDALRTHEPLCPLFNSGITPIIRSVGMSV
ncbi:hypothetical protein DNTS_028473 [Danionella cerebrum]|uniref:BZIP domain-containing protein n=1 Tax=Danionella cerebrum TaxID=2873325 RepID=A0A553R7F3_9TELE|nr:hypothetical protein DNTS_028473 [Danionella translucida]